MDCNERKPSAVSTQQKKSAFRIIIKVAIYDRLRLCQCEILPYPKSLTRVIKPITSNSIVNKRYNCFEDLNIIAAPKKPIALEPQINVHPQDFIKTKQKIPAIKRRTDT